MGVDNDTHKMFFSGSLDLIYVDSAISSGSSR